MKKKIPTLVGLLLVQRFGAVIARGIMSELPRLVGKLPRTLLKVRGWLGVRMLV